MEKRFGDKILIKSLTLAMPSDSVTAVIGPSGVGKTTLLRMIAGLESPTKGQVFLDDDDSAKLVPGERGVSYLFQRPVLYDHMSVAQNIAFPLRIAGVPGAERKRRVLELARLLEIEAILKQMPRTLSGGEWQRAALARCYARTARVRLLDEPVKAALEPRLRLSLRKIIRRLHREMGGTTIIVTHDQEEGLELADSILVLLGGADWHFGSARALFESPPSVGVARFLGGGVELRAAYLDAKPALRTVSGLTIELTGCLPSAPSGLRTWILRPEAVRVGAGRGFLIEDVAYRGAESEVTVVSESRDLRLVGRANGRLTLKIEQGVGVRVETTLLSWFN